MNKKVFASAAALVLLTLSASGLGTHRATLRPATTN